MLGLGDGGVSLAFILTLGSTALCAVYGFLNWNKPAPEVEIEEIAEEEAWEKNEMPKEARGGQQ
jgi:hypothetical protein